MIYLLYNLLCLLIYYKCGLSPLFRRTASLRLTCLGIEVGQLFRLQDISHVTGRKEGNVLFNYALNTFYLRLYGVRHMVKDHSDSEKGNPLPPHRQLFPISSKGYFICTIPQTG